MSRGGIFEGMDDKSIEVALRHFDRLEVGARQQLIAEGDVDASLAIVESGELVVKTGDTKLGYVRDGECVGEMALFTNGMRTATVTSVTPTKLLVLDAEGMARLRSFDSPVVVAIEELALDGLSNRLRDIAHRISEEAEGTEVEHVVPAKGFFDRMTSMLGTGGTTSAGRVDKAAVLRSSQIFAGMDPDDIAALAKEFDAIGFRKGHFVLTEGKPGDEMYIVARGLLEVFVDTRGDKVEPLAALEPGEAFGMCALVQDEHTRMASCVAKEDSVCLSMDRIKFAEVIRRADRTGSALRVAMIRALTDQLAFANAQLALIEMQANMAALARAGVGMEAHGHYLHTPDYLQDT